MNPKARIDDLAAFGGAPLFAAPISTANLVRPDVDTFLAYTRGSRSAGRWTDGGPSVRQLEARLAAFHGTRHSVSFVSGFWSIVLAMRCVALAGRREVVMPSFTYRRMADIVAWAGLVPRFCEVEADTLAVSARTAAPCIDAGTALLLGVHPIVNRCDVAGLERLSAQSGIPLLFDSVEAVHGTIGGKRVGGFGRAECFSLHASKLFNGFEGGYVVTDDGELARRLEQLRSGVPGAGGALGMHAGLNEVHAAMALACLDELPAQIERNRVRYRSYQRGLDGIEGIRLVPFDERETANFKSIVVELLEGWPLARDATVDLLNREHLFARAMYAPALHRKATWPPIQAVQLPLSDRLAQRFILMPSGQFVDEAAARSVCGVLRFLGRNGAAIRARLEACTP